MTEKIKGRNSIPRYQQIAIEVATRIASGEYKVGDKIYAVLPLQVSTVFLRKRLGVLFACYQIWGLYHQKRAVVLQ